MTPGDRALTGVVDDHPLFRDTIAAVVEATPELELGPVVTTASDALRAFGVRPPDLAVIDYSIGDDTATGLAATIGERWPATRCLVLSGHRNNDYAAAVIGAGARAYVLKGRPEEFRRAVRAVLAGETYVSPSVLADA